MKYSWQKLRDLWLPWFGDLVCAYCSKSKCPSCLVQDKSRCLKRGRIREPPYKFFRRNFLFIMLFVACWFFTAGVYPFPYFVTIGKSSDPAIMEPILIATGVMAIPFTFIVITWKKRPPPKWGQVALSPREDWVFRWTRDLEIIFQESPVSSTTLPLYLGS